MTAHITLIDKNEIVDAVKKWIKYIKTEFQIKEYEYSNTFEIGTVDIRPLILNVTTIPPKPIIEYIINIENADACEVKELLDFLTNNTKVI